MGKISRNAETDAKLIALLEPGMQRAARFVLAEAQRILDERDPGMYRIHITSTWRSPDTQRKLFEQGRKFDATTKTWVKDPSAKLPIVTNARPGQSPHEIVAADGVTPAALAFDSTIFLCETGAILRNGHLAWSIIPFVAHIAPEDLESGAFFSAVSDWPHLQAAGWKLRAERGKLRP